MSSRVAAAFQRLTAIKAKNADSAALRVPVSVSVAVNGLTVERSYNEDGNCKHCK